VGHEVAVHLHLSMSSDHANFAFHGVPAMRLIAGLNEPECGQSRLLTAADLHDAVHLDELHRATEVAGAMLWRALTVSDDEMATLRHGTPRPDNAMAALAPLPG
jgi:hypothetical protein